MSIQYIRVHNLIKTYTFINFWQNLPPTRLNGGPTWLFGRLEYSKNEDFFWAQYSGVPLNFQSIIETYLN